MDRSTTTTLNHPWIEAQQRLTIHDRSTTRLNHHGQKPKNKPIKANQHQEIKSIKRFWQRPKASITIQEYEATQQNMVFKKEGSSTMTRTCINTAAQYSFDASYHQRPKTIMGCKGTEIPNIVLP
ncbi:hypothetical protein MTR_5g095955 [Medicago truncatula]|uniref:Uncharacterized protein n=1 Tax=Medicago truncatula TaxID=3880 RepID=A0A072URG6_MEDTR|nr:hypothetical protein MTR_5g095955 [Medicago truncatula]